ncbi:MAG: hypothetical protein K0R57_4425 [Paenibacillaceae bacterium]|jgi:two-component system response regulator YesN|nr:hypothetical protein [Paenibacillaceae bacterium]
MVKVLIAEDEAIILEGMITKIHWDELGLQLAGTAGDGSRALQLFRELLPDILITDIRMPAMDGLTLIKEVKRLKPQTVCIIISGIGEFSFAREAMELGVTRYLLKPLNEAEINSVLASKLGELERDSEDRLTVEKLKADFRKYADEIQELILSKLVSETAEDRLEAKWADFGFRRTGSALCAAVFALGRIAFPHLRFQAGEEPLLWFGVKNIIGECLRQESLHGVVFKHAFKKREIVAVVELAEEMDRERAGRAFERAWRNVDRLLRIPVAVGRGGEAARPEELRRSYAEASLASQNRIIRGYGAVYALGQAASVQNSKPVTEAEEKTVLRWLEESRTQELGEWLRARMLPMTDPAGGQYREWERFCLEVHRLFRSITAAKNADGAALLGDYPTFLQEVANAENWMETLSDLMKQAAAVANCCSPGGRRTGEDIVEEVKRVISSDCQKDISLLWISQQYYIHANYFSRLFKEKTGMNLTDYIMQTRMDQAYRLVKTTDMQIRSIAEMVGYDNAAYFGMLFRKTFGQSPIQVREDEKRAAAAESTNPHIKGSFPCITPPGTDGLS